MESSVTATEFVAATVAPDKVVPVSDGFQMLMAPLSWVYGTVIWLRNVCYDAGIFSAARAAVPVISVGNITVGGTGKTPFVEYLVRYFLDKNKKVAVLSRGYKRRSHGSVVVGSNEADRGSAARLGDEPYLIARKFPAVTMVVDGKRVRAAESAVSRHGVDVILLDDGFQHRALARDLDIVMIDGLILPERMRMLPAGKRRDTLNSLKRADVLAFSNVPASTPSLSTPDLVRHQLKVDFTPRQFCTLDRSKSVNVQGMRGKSCVAFCGIANPVSFINSLTALGLYIAESIEFPDHHYFSKSDLNRIRDSLLKNKPDMAITTEKDSVRLLPRGMEASLSSFPLYYLEIEAVVTEGKSRLEDLLDKLLERN